MRCPSWLYNLFHPRALSRFKDNLYTQYDSGISPKYFMFELYGEPISTTTDERTYLFGAIELLRKEGRLVEEYVCLEDEIKKREDEEIPRFYPGDNEGTSFYLYRDNLIRLKLDDDQTAKMDFYYPLTKKCAVGDFEQWVMQKKGESRVSILVMRNGSLVAHRVSFAPPVITDLEMNYGTGFTKTYDKLVNKLKENGSSLTLLHGDPGTGKSMLIKHLTSVVDREFIFIPSNCTERLSSPDFISLLLNKKEAILILEDAEQSIQTRGTNFSNENAVSTLLNLSDGVLGNCLNIGLVLSYNCDKQLVDPALLRKGRLNQDIKFGPLCQADAERLAKHLGKEIEVKGPMTLADIYGAGEDTGFEPKEERQMGFHTLGQDKQKQSGV